MEKFKLRAECSIDVLEFLKIRHRDLMNFRLDRDPDFPDVEFEFETELTLEEIREDLKIIDDGHVMIETVSEIESYTGERN